MIDPTSTQLPEDTFDDQEETMMEIDEQGRVYPAGEAPPESKRQKPNIFRDQKGEFGTTL